MSEDKGKISDGYHTFNELYEHRNLLFIAWILSDGCLGDRYYVKEHYPEWDLVVAWLTPDKQISYHVPSKLRPLYEKRITCRELEQHKYDGHTSDDVLKRLRRYLSNG